MYMHTSQIYHIYLALSTFDILYLQTKVITSQPLVATLDNKSSVSSATYKAENDTKNLKIYHINGNFNTYNKANTFAASSSNFILQGKYVGNKHERLKKSLTKYYLNTTHFVGWCLKRMVNTTHLLRTYYM